MTCLGEDKEEKEEEEDQADEKSEGKGGYEREVFLGELLIDEIKTQM